MSDKLKKTIDRMVEDSIRRILPAVMNEVLLKTIANANVIREETTKPIQVTRSGRPAALTPSGAMKRPSSLSQLLDESAGADFYQDPRAAMVQAVQEEVIPRGEVIAQRIQSLPPALQGLAEGVDLDDDGGEMWESDMGDSVSIPSAGMGPPLEKAAQVAGLDFSRMKQAINLTEKKSAKATAADKAANAQFEQQRLKMMRERLNGGKPVE